MEAIAHRDLLVVGYLDAVDQPLDECAGQRTVGLDLRGILLQRTVLLNLRIDFALKKDATESPPRYLVFFKGRDADVLTAAFKEFSAKKLTQEKKPSIRKLLSTLKEAAQGKNAERAKVKNKDREVSL